jgi:hypothetical protein
MHVEDEQKIDDLVKIIHSKPVSFTMYRPLT